MSEEQVNVDALWEKFYPWCAAGAYAPPPEPVDAVEHRTMKLISHAVSHHTLKIEDTIVQMERYLVDVAHAPDVSVPAKNVADMLRTLQNILKRRD